MLISKRQQIITFSIWLFIFPLVSFLAYTHFPMRSPDWMNIILLFGIMFLTMLLPVRFQTVTISLERWITITVFLQYGVFTEFIFIQLAMLILLFGEKSTLPLTHKFFVNSTIFGITSLASAYVFYLVGGNFGTYQFSHLFLIGLLYAVAYTMVNNLLLKVYFWFNNRRYSLMSKGALWDYISTLIMFPFSLSLYYLNENLGNKSLLLLGIPFLFILITIRMYNNSNTLHSQLHSAGQIGHELADRLVFDEVLQTFLIKLQDVVPFENAYVVDLRSERALIPLMGMESGKIIKVVENISFLHEKRENDGLELKNSKIYYNKKEVRQLKNIRFSKSAESVITAPIIRNNNTEGFLFLTTNRKNFYSNSDIQIIEILTGYFAISLEKARYFEKTLNKSERCGLTKLHNYRYLDRKLDDMVNAFHAKEIDELSVIIMDIDYFKSVNDTYGHESGNEILKQLANLLSNFQKEVDVLARYGGEEFVFLLPNCSKHQAVQTAEEIREKVEKNEFTVYQDLSKKRIEKRVHITLSLGVASIPDDAANAKKVMRNADRALYLGGKQAGRNKVGVFMEHETPYKDQTQTLKPT